MACPGTLIPFSDKGLTDEPPPGARLAASTMTTEDEHGCPGSGPALCRAAARQAEGVCGDRRGHAGAGHRRQHPHLQLRQLLRLQAAAHEGSVAAGHDLREASRTRPRSCAGRVCRLPRLATAEHFLSRPRGGSPAALQPHRRRRPPARPRVHGYGRHLHGMGPRDHPGPGDPARGRPPGRSARGLAQPWLLVAPVRSRSHGGGPHASARRRALPRDRRARPRHRDRHPERDRRVDAPHGRRRSGRPRGSDPHGDRPPEAGRGRRAGGRRDGRLSRSDKNTIIPRRTPVGAPWSCPSARP